MKRSRTNILLPALALGALACGVSDVTQPERQPSASAEVQPSSFSVDKSPPAADTSRGYMIVGPQGGNWNFGDHKINFPANSLCDMSQTRYSDWGKPCAALTSDIRIDIAWWRDADGHPHVEFSPAMRFQPTKRGEVMLYLKDATAARSAQAVIRYCGSLTGLCMDESTLDQAMATKRDPKGGFVFRAIRHFSGYNVWA